MRYEKILILLILAGGFISLFPDPYHQSPEIIYNERENHLTIRFGQPIQKGEFRYRYFQSGNGSDFITVPLIQDRDLYSAIIPANPSNTRKYLEYYFQYDGGRFPHEGFFRIKTGRDRQGPRLITDDPEKNQQPGDRIEYCVSVIDENDADYNSLKIYLNDISYTDGPEVFNNRVCFRWRDLPEGEYRVRISISDMSGNITEHSGKISVTKTSEYGKNQDQWKYTGSFSQISSSAAIMNDSKDLTLQELRKNGVSTVNFSFKAEKTDSEIEIGPLVITDAPAQPGYRQNRFSFAFRQDLFRIRAGDISGDISPRTLSTNIFGTQVSWGQTVPDRKNPLLARVAYGQILAPISTEKTELNRYGRNAVGLLSRYYLLNDLNIFAAGQWTFDDASSVPEPIPQRELLKNASGEAGLELRKEKLNFSGGYSISRFNQEQIRSHEKQGYAVDMKLGYNFTAIALQSGIDFSETSENYVSLSGSGGSPDKRSITGNLAKSFQEGRINLSNQFSFSHNNLRKSKVRTDSNISASSSFSATVFKDIGFNTTINTSMDRSEGNVLMKTERDTRSFSGNLSLPFKFLIRQNSAPAFNYTESIDKSLPESSPDSFSRGVSLNHQFIWAKDWSSSLIFSRNSSYTPRNEMESISIQEGFSNQKSFYNGKLGFILGGSRNQSFQIKMGEDQLVNTIFSGNLGIQSKPIENLTLQLSGTYSSSISPERSPAMYPGNLSIQWQLNWTF